MLVQISCGISRGTTSPIARVYAHLHQPVKRRVRPVDHLRHMSMFDGIEMQVVHVCIEIGRVADQVLPITPLPNSAFAASVPNGRAPFIGRQAFREPGLDQSPAQREIGIPLWKFDHAMHMVWQHHPTVNCKRMPTADVPQHIAQRINMTNEEVVALALQGVDGEEIRAAGTPGTSVIRHVWMMPIVDIRRNALRLLRPTRYDLLGIGAIEIGTARTPGASVIRHGWMMPIVAIRRNALRLLRPTVFSPQLSSARSNSAGCVATCQSGWSSWGSRLP